MKKFFKIDLFVAMLALVFTSACTQVEEDLREHDYGYVQFKLYKAASYAPVDSSRAVVDELD